MRRKHHRCYQGRFTRLASRYRSLFAFALACLALLCVPGFNGSAHAQSATYRVTFEGRWTTAATPDGVPGGAHFSPLIAAVHNDQVTFWREGGTASAGIESMAEVGGTNALKTDITAAGSNAGAVIERIGNIGATATVTADFTVTSTHPLVTLLSMVAPSPDRFVGVSGLTLLDAQGDWLASHSVDLFPYDAGTEEGTEFSLNNTATSPQGTITSIKGTGKFSNEPIASLTFTLQAINTAPSFTSDTGFEVDENQTVVGTVAATDPDSGDEVAYAISGGADASKFDIGETTGVLTFTTPPDYESAVDIASTQPLNDAGNNEYIVTVRATGGTAERAMTSEQTITVTVTDVDEPPEAPEAPTVRAASLTSLAVTWTAPANTGPAITGYDVRYKATGGAFTNWNHDSANTTTTITDLTPNRRYYVQVGARNHEGPSDWSESGALPNIIWIMADDLGYGDLGSYGQTRILTPNLDRMASEGMRFTDAYAGAPICAPSRSVLMTGQHAGRTRVWWNYSLGLWDEDVTVAELLGASGYATALIGKWGLGEEDSPGAPWRQGFDYFFGYLNQGHAHNYYPEFLIRNPGTRVPLNNIVVSFPDRDLVGVATQREDYSHDLFISDALDWIEENESTPFFLYLPLTIPHANNDATRDLIPPELGPHRSRIGMEVPDAGVYRNKIWRGPLKGTAAMITRMDAGVGQIIDKLKELNIDEQTIVFFTSDNGPHSQGGNDSRFFNSSGPLQGEKGSLHDGGIRVPMIVRWPGRVPAGTVSNLVWYFADFLPTMAELVGFENPDGIDGTSILSDLLGGSSRIGDRLIYWWNGGRVDGARWGRWKAVWDVRESKDQPLELFDLHQDLGERNDVASTNQDVATTMLDYMASAVTNETEKKWAPAPVVSSVEFTSSPASGQNGAYKLGDVIEVTATFSDGVTVTTTDGAPQIDLTLGSTPRKADYVGGSTTQQLLFQYTVQATDQDTDGATIEANGLKRNGGRIRKNGTVLHTTLTHGAQTDQSGHKVDGVAPTVSRVRISSNPGSDRTYAAGDEIRVTVTFRETVEVTGTPRLQLELGGGLRTAAYRGGTGTAALVFAYEVAGGESDTDGVGVKADSLSGGTITDEARNNAVLDHDGLAVDAGHKVDAVKPELAASGGAVVDGTRLTLTWDEPLDGSSTPVSGDFTVSGGDHVRTVTRVRVSGSTVVLTLDSGAEHEEAGIRVSYTPGTNPIRDVPGNQAEALSRQSVRNETPDTTPPEVSSLAIGSNPGSDRIYAAGDEIQMTVTFSETVEVEGAPRLRLRVGIRNRTAGYLRGTGTAALVFGYEVADGEEDTDGVSIEANRLTLNGGTIKDEADNPAELAHGALAVQAGHQVDGVRPAFVSAAVDGSSLTLTYGEALDGGSRPAAGDFTVEVDGSGRSVAGVSVSGSGVTLFLNPAVEHGDRGIRVSYTVPMGVGANPIRDAVGNQARELSSRSVTNTTGSPNTAPEITSPSSFDVPENRTVARRLAARDSDPGDEVTGWALVGGADQGQFSIASDTGDLSFREPSDYEAPGDNQYLVTVEVRSGAGAREFAAEKTLTVRVTDEREPPGVPEAPTFSGETADSLRVSWSEPDNTGPDITDYDVQYREKGTGGFTDGDHQGPGLTLTLTDLNPGTVYEVQVRATNEEGTGGWSDPGEGMTIPLLTLEMMAMQEPPVSGPFAVRFSFSELVTGFTSSDIETQQEPACRDSANNTVFCDPGIGALQTTDDRVFTATVTPWTDRVAHSYTLTLTVPGGAVRSLVGSKPNEEPEEPLEVRVSPPGAPEPISSIGLQASSGSGSVRLSWNLPSDNGGSAIIRYEYRYQAVGEAWSEWENVGAGTRSVTVGNLVNGREYVFEVRAVNGLGKGGAETVMAVPERRIAPPRPPPAPRPPGNGDGGGLLFPPEAPASLTALPGEGAVRLEWSPPESDGGTPILRHEYRLKEGLGEFGEWTPIADSGAGEVNATGYTVGELGNGTVYVFELRAVNLVGEGRVSEAVEVVMGLDGAYWSNFGGEELQGSEAGLEHTPFGGTPRSVRLRFGADLRFEESELDGEGEVTGTRAGSYGYRYTSRTTGELRLDYDGGESCELRLTFRGEGTGSYSYRCGGRLGGQGSFRFSGLNRRPEITGAGVFEVAENRAVVGRLEAVDPDEGDGIEGYGIAGGADASLFVIEAETGELLFREAPDYETPGDVESAEPASGAGDNEYIVVVEVSSGEGERERKGSRAIRVRVSDEEEPPEITSIGPFEVVENRTMVGRLEAVDQDKQDEIREYGIAGGADGGLFAVAEETGELLFREAPDYEDPGDVESAEPASGAGDNEYIVVVEVSSGEGERERRGSRAIRVRVADEEEPPGAPAAPAVTAEGSHSLKVRWREPENRGPAIVDYEVRYREAGEAGYSDGGHQGRGLMVRLSGLKEGTVYEVQVRAVNEEGMSEWSEPGEGRTDREEADPDDPSDFSGKELEGRRLTLRQADADGTTRSLELRFGEGNRFEQIESGGQEAATRSEGASRSGSYSYEKTGPGRGRLRLAYDDGSFCEIRLSFAGTGVGGFVYDCGGGAPAEGSFRLTTGSLFVPVILSAAGQNQSLFTSELTLTNRGEREARLHYTYTAHFGGGSGRASDVLAPGRQKIETDALVYLRSLGIAIPETGNRIGTLRVEVPITSEVRVMVRTTTAVDDGRAGLAYAGIPEEEGFTEAVYLCGLRQNGQDRSNLAFQNMGAPEEGAITMRTTVYSGEAGDTSARVLEDVKLEPGGFHQYSGLLGVLGVPAQGYVKVERVEGRASFYAYGVINDQANSDGSFVFPVTASSLVGVAGQTLPVMVETSAFTSELTVTNFSEEARTLQFSFVAGGVGTPDRTADFTLMPMRLEGGEQRILADIVNRLRQQGVEGIGPSRGSYAGALFATVEDGDMSGIVIGARTGSEGGGGQYSVFYNAVPVGAAFSEVAWIDALQQNGENRSNLALVNTGEVDGSDSVFSLEIYDGETGLLVTTIATRPIPARGWHQINGILGSYAPETRQGYVRIRKVSGENPFLAYGVVNDGGAPGERSGDGAYLPARE